MFSVQKVVTFGEDSHGVYSQSTHEVQQAAELRAQSLALDEKREDTQYIVLGIEFTVGKCKITPIAHYIAKTGERQDLQCNTVAKRLRNVNARVATKL
jgi:hypothetical protein